MPRTVICSPFLQRSDHRDTDRVEDHFAELVIRTAMPYHGGVEVDAVNSRVRQRSLLISRGLSVGGTGLEPVTPSLSRRSRRSLAFARVHAPNPASTSLL